MRNRSLKWLITYLGLLNFHLELRLYPLNRSLYINLIKIMSYLDRKYNLYYVVISSV